MAVRLFVSYAHEDARLKNQLVEHLSNLRNQGVIDAWEDRQLVPGTDWSAEIQRQLDAADFVLLLISSSFLASGYCTTVEMKQALDSGRAIPILLREVDWAGAPFSKLQVLPTEAKPVTAWKSRDAAFTDVVKGIRRAIAAAARPAAAIWNVPHAHNPNFVGREELLDDLPRALAKDSAAAVVQAISGLGGVGKTQIAVEYAYRSRSRYSLVWWIRSEPPTTLASDYAALATRLGLPLAADQAVTVAAVKAWLETHEGWLLVFDNVEKADDVTPYLPAGRAGHVVITSRDPNWRGIAEPLAVEVLTPEDAVRLLLRRSGRKDEAAAGEVAKEFGYLPLAIEQAAAYLEEHGTPVAEYLQLFRTRRKDLWARDQRPLAAVWQMSIEKVRAANAEAEALLHRMAYFAPEDVPREVLRGKTDPLAFDDAVAALRRYSLIKTEDGALSMHRLQQFAIRDSESPEEQARWCAEAAGLLSAALNLDIFDSRTWPTLDRLLPHALSVNDHAIALDVATEAIAVICFSIGSYLSERARFDLGDLLLSRAAQILEMWKLSDSLRFAQLLTNTADSRRQRGDFEGALELHERALEINRRLLGEEDVVATGLSNVAVMLMDLKKYPEAVAKLREALAIDQRLALRTSGTAARWLNLASALYEEGRREEALEPVKKALVIEEELYGKENAKLVVTLLNMGRLQEEVDNRASEVLFERALSICDRTYGDNHPDAMEVLFSMADIRLRRDRVAEARQFADRLLAAAKRVFGESHPKVTEYEKLYARLLSTAPPPPPHPSPTRES